MPDDKRPQPTVSIKWVSASPSVVRPEMRDYRADLHIHTVLSPCTEIGEMTPKKIVEAALRKGLDVIAVCDHNSCRNAGAAQRAAHGTGLTVIAGIEITSSEEVHILGLFPDLASALRVQDAVYARLPGQNDEDAFGVQVVVDEDDMVEDLDDRLLIGATTLSAERVAKLIGSEGGLTIASHVDRSGFGIFAQLGFIPPGLRLDALEFSRRTTAEAVKTRYRQAHAYPLITSSDAHCPEEIGAAYTVFFLNEARVEDIRSALHGHAERRVVAYGPSG